MTESGCRGQAPGDAGDDARLSEPCHRMQEFLDSGAGERKNTARRARQAMAEAVASGVDVVALSAALDISAFATRSIIDGRVALEDLHPQAAP